MALFVPKDRKSLFRQFLAGMYDAVIITDPNGHIIEINPRAEEHFGYVQDEVVDKPISFFIPGLSPEVVQRIRRGLENDRHMMLDAKGRCKSDDKFACEVTVSVIDLMDPGDLVFTRSEFNHVGIYIGGGMMIHAPHPGAVVCIAEVYAFYGGGWAG